MISPEELKVSFVETVMFPSAGTKGTHTYGFEGAEEFVGGDEPWDDEFVGGDEPWDNEFIGEDPWDNRIDIVFSMSCPDGWTFKAGKWPSGMNDLLNQQGTVVGMDDAAVRRSYNSTVGGLDSIQIQKDDGDDNGSPGFGALVAFLAVAVATFTIIRGRRR